MRNATRMVCCIASFFCCISFSAFSNDANWMSSIPNDRILNQLIIPGTHDSDTASIKPQSKFSLSPDAPVPLWFQIISNLLPKSIVRPIVAGWSKTQPYSIQKQLNQGIRYFDFRACLYPDTQFYSCHALIGLPFGVALEQIQNFIEQHPSEIVLVDINHIYNVKNSADETRLIQMLQLFLGNIAVPNSYHPTSTMGDIRQSNRNVIILMDVNQPISDPIAAQFAAQYLWHESNINSPWPNASNPHDLKSTLDSEIAFRAKTVSSATDFFVLQAIQTESTDQVIDGILDPKQFPHTIRWYEMPVNIGLTNYLDNEIAIYGQPAINIVIQDWFTKKDNLVNFAVQYDTQQTFRIQQSVSPEKLSALRKWSVTLK